jgi:hypothetical protein
MRSRTLSGLVIGLVGVCHAAAPAASADPAQPKPAAAGNHERICETITLTGSRLGKKRFCATRAEWADRRLQDRHEIEKIQRSPCVVNGTTCK